MVPKFKGIPNPRMVKLMANFLVKKNGGPWENPYPLMKNCLCVQELEVSPN